MRTRRCGGGLIATVPADRAPGPAIHPNGSHATTGGTARGRDQPDNQKSPALPGFSVTVSRRCPDQAFMLPVSI